MKPDDLANAFHLDPTASAVIVFATRRAHFPLRRAARNGYAPRP